ncbi:MAG: hypothetical protein LH478_15090 [Chitinophagaceae bacterium]|nr:hypothetical protein [Chitinophagaceae bacterium]
MLARELEVSGNRDMVVKEDVCDIVRGIKQAKNDIVKWMFIFWVAQFVATAGMLFAFFNFYFKK